VLLHQHARRLLGIEIVCHEMVFVSLSRKGRRCAPAFC